jgi:hypothetical protein
MALPIAEMVNSRLGCGGLPAGGRADIAAPGSRSYVDGNTPRGGKSMSPTATIAAGRSRVLVIAVLAGALMLAGSLALWAYYGTAVFFEILRAGWAACF